MSDLIAGAPLAVLLVTAGLLVVAAIDIKTHAIHGATIVCLAAVAILGLQVDGASPVQLTTGVIAGLAAMGLLLEYTVNAQPALDAQGRGTEQQIGAGDIKVIGIPVAVFAASNLPLAAIFLALSTTLQAGLIRVSGSRALPMGPALAISACLSLYWLTHGLFGEVI